MAPLIPNGVYVIRNVASKDVVCLRDGMMGGPIVGYKDGPGYPCEQRNLWRIRNIGEGGNQASIESVCIPGSFANAQGEFQDSPLFGAPTPTIWTIVKVDRGYYIQSPDANYVWQFVVDGAPIVLVHHTAKDNTRWQFQMIE